MYFIYYYSCKYIYSMIVFVVLNLIYANLKSPVRIIFTTITAMSSPHIKLKTI